MTKNQEKGTFYYHLLACYDFFCGGNMKIFLYFLPWFYPCLQSFHDLNIVPAHLCSNFSIFFAIYMIPRFLKLFVHANTLSPDTTANQQLILDMLRFTDVPPRNLKKTELN